MQIKTCAIITTLFSYGMFEFIYKSIANQLALIFHKPAIPFYLLSQYLAIIITKKLLGTVLKLDSFCDGFTKITFRKSHQ